MGNATIAAVYFLAAALYCRGSPPTSLLILGGGWDFGGMDEGRALVGSCIAAAIPGEWAVFEAGVLSLYGALLRTGDLAFTAIYLYSSAALTGTPSIAGGR
jgi:hypothetical protein